MSKTWFAYSRDCREYINVTDVIERLCGSRLNITRNRFNVFVRSILVRSLLKMNQIDSKYTVQTEYVHSMSYRGR